MSSILLRLTPDALEDDPQIFQINGEVQNKLNQEVLAKGFHSVRSGWCQPTQHLNRDYMKLDSPEARALVYLLELKAKD